MGSYTNIFLEKEDSGVGEQNGCKGEARRLNETGLRLTTDRPLTTPPPPPVPHLLPPLDPSPTPHLYWCDGNYNRSSFLFLLQKNHDTTDGWIEKP